MNIPPAKTPPRILVIDDNRAIHDDFRKIFEIDENVASLDAAEASLFGDTSITKRRQFRIASAHQGREGLALVQQACAAGDPFAMAFVDVRMPPGWDGIETIAHIWAVYPDLQVVICTAYSDYSWDEMHEKLGDSDRLVILKKPFDNVEVLQLAGTLTEKWRLLQQTRRHTLELENTIGQARKFDPTPPLSTGTPESNSSAKYVGDHMCFVRNSIAKLLPVLQAPAQLLTALRENKITPELIAETEAVLKQANIEQLVTEIPKAIDQSLHDIEQVARIIQTMKTSSSPGTDKT